MTEQFEFTIPDSNIKIYAKSPVKLSRVMACIANLTKGCFDGDVNKRVNDAIKANGITYKDGDFYLNERLVFGVKDTTGLSGFNINAGIAALIYKLEDDVAIKKPLTDAIVRANALMSLITVLNFKPAKELIKCHSQLENDAHLAPTNTRDNEIKAVASKISSEVERDIVMSAINWHVYDSGSPNAMYMYRDGDTDSNVNIILSELVKLGVVK